MNILEHLTGRWFNPEFYPNVVVSEEEQTVVLPLFNLSGRMVGYQQYTPGNPKCHLDDPRLARYFTWVTKPVASKNAELAVWGLETVTWTDKWLFLTEGVFDACRLHWHGLPAVAVLSNNPVHLRSWLTALNQRKVACVQGDAAGKKLGSYGDLAVFLPEGKDVGDLTVDEFHESFGRFL